MVKIVGLAAIDKSIKALAKVGDNLNARVQDTAVAIIAHAEGPGNGDVSRALTLCQAVNKMRSLNVAYLVGFFFYFGNCRVNLKDAEVKLRGKDTKGYRGFDAAGAALHNWYEAFDPKTGERAAWYAGPQPAEFQPATIGDVAEDFRRFVKRELDKLDGTRDVNGKVVPLVQISEADRIQLDNALELIERIANTLARHEEIEQGYKLVAEAQEAANSDEEVVAILQQPRKAAAAAAA